MRIKLPEVDFRFKFVLGQLNKISIERIRLKRILTEDNKL